MEQRSADVSTSPHQLTTGLHRRPTHSSADLKEDLGATKKRSELPNSVRQKKPELYSQRDIRSQEDPDRAGPTANNDETDERKTTATERRPEDSLRHQTITQST